MPESPSDALAGIAGALFAVECSRDIANEELERWLSEATDRLMDDLPFDNGVDEWTLDSADVLILAMRGMKWPISPLKTSEEFFLAVRAVQILDRWHLPLVPSDSPELLPKRRGHVVVEDRMSADGLFGLSTEGIVIPASAWGRPARERTEWASPNSMIGLEPPMPLPMASRPMLLHELLSATAFLPSQLPIQNPQNDSSSKRHIRLSYLAVTDNVLPTSIQENMEVIAIAPALEMEEDARIEISSHGTRYCVRPTYSMERISSIIISALSTDVSTLFFPECAIDAHNVQWMQNEILSLTRSRWKSTGILPKLRYIFAGFSDCDNKSAKAAGNFVAIFDSMGREIVRQSKLFPWNLSQSQIERLGFNVDFDVRSDTLYENIELGDELIVCDLPYAGRVINLICADVNEDAPGDWLLAHLRADWLHAPIFDKSACWTFDQKGIDGPWISRRARRAALLAATRVVVTNSMSLTNRLNRWNLRRGDTRIYSDCGIGLLLDSTDEITVIKQVLVPLDHPSPVVAVEVWRDGWPPLNPPSSAPG